MFIISFLLCSFHDWCWVFLLVSSFSLRLAESFYIISVSYFYTCEIAVKPNFRDVKLVHISRLARILCI